MGEAWGQIFNQVLGIALDSYNRDNQNRQQQKLTNQQVAAQKDLGKFNQGLAMDMWNKSSSEIEKRKRLEKAGLNVGLMYQQGGAQGTTQGGQAGNVTGGVAAPEMHGMGMMMQMAATKAQIENTKAQTALTDAERRKLEGTDIPKAEAETGNIKTQTEGQAITNRIKAIDEQLATIRLNVENKTQEAAIQTIEAARKKMEGDAQQSQIAGAIDQATMREEIQQIKLKTTQEQLTISAQKAGLIKTGADTSAIEQSTRKMAAEIVNLAAQREIKWMEIDQQERERIIREKIMKLQEAQTEFYTSTPQQIKQWTSIITDIIGSITGAGSSHNAAGFKY